ncbi:hypothetical protein [Clostridium sp. BNL1100]|uniref:hypothetical protein n=1 Tax=Clostridium sp. BNL1100 TaxID=755731 RepID=UPI00024A72A7|nr:hypothetical protein [Clostridium sp. BNL1100]AEY66352.1 hypothetical protein Clo1100_2169 [Clostridium sp. BNL1100]
MAKVIDLEGQKYGILTVVKGLGRGKKEYEWLCKCECGNETISKTSYLRSGHKTSCGCLRGRSNYKHGLSQSPLRNVHANMKKRCNNPKNKSFKNYGGRGITYCEKWETFEGFLDDMLDDYKKGLTLDRIDVNGNYNKENCRWVDKKTQANNTTANRHITYKGETLTVSQTADKYGIDYELFRHRLKKGLAIDEALKPISAVESVTYNGETKTVAEWARLRGMTYYQLKKRLMRGWDIDRALTQPLRKRDK